MFGSTYFIRTKHLEQLSKLRLQPQQKSGYMQYARAMQIVHTHREGGMDSKGGVGGETSIANLVPISTTNGQGAPSLLLAIHCLLLFGPLLHI